MLNENLPAYIGQFIKNTVSSRKAEGVIVPLSGGLDSSVTAMLAKNAIGPENVYSYTTYENDEKESEDVKDAVLMARRLKINHELICIDKISDFLEEYIPDKEQKAYSGGYIRTMLSYRYADRTNSIVACSTNKTEKLLGIFLPYANGGDFFPLADIYKSEVRQLARYIGIPKSIINKPSRGSPAEIPAEKQIGCSFETVDKILYMLVEKNEDSEFIAKYLNYDLSFIENIRQKIEKANKKLEFPYFQASYLFERDELYM